jgi:hypothetical protein
MIGERQNVSAAFAQRRDGQRKNIQAKIQVLAKVAAGYRSG